MASKKPSDAKPAAAVSVEDYEALKAQVGDLAKALGERVDGLEAAATEDDGRLKEIGKELAALRDSPAMVVTADQQSVPDFDFYTVTVGLSEINATRALGWTLIHCEFVMHDVVISAARGRTRQVKPVALWGRMGSADEDIDAAREAADQHGEATLSQLQVDVAHEESEDAAPRVAAEPQPAPIGSHPSAPAQGFESHGIRT